MDKESKGFIKLDRNIFNHWIFQDAEKFKAFVDLIQLARWKDEKLLIGNDLITVPRGSYYTSELKLAERWGWGRDKTRNFLTLMESEGMISKKGTTKGTMVTVENYRFYQDEHPTQYTTKTQRTNIKPDIKPTSNQHQTNIKPDTKEEVKEVKEIIRKDKKEEEGEEKPPQLQPLLFPSPVNEKIFNEFGEVVYRTWFEDAVVKEHDNQIEISVPEEFKRNVIRDKYAWKLGIITGKQIAVKEGDT